MSKINKLILHDPVLSEFYEHLIELEEVDSTNNFAKNLNEKKNGICIYSANQKFGYGRNNRKWISHKDKSIALSIILKYLINLFYAGYFFGIGFFLTGTYWISNSLQFDDKVSIC